jgi:hypothetical protein
MAVGRTVRPYQVDCLPVQRGPPAQVEGAQGGSGGPRTFFGPSARPADRSPRPDCPHVSCVGGAGVAD